MVNTVTESDSWFVTPPPLHGSYSPLLNTMLDVVWIFLPPHSVVAHKGRGSASISFTHHSIVSDSLYGAFQNMSFTAHHKHCQMATQVIHAVLSPQHKLLICTSCSEERSISIPRPYAEQSSHWPKVHCVVNHHSIPGSILLCTVCAHCDT